MEQPPETSSDTASRARVRLPHGERLTVPPRGLLFGRSPSCDLTLKDPRASSVHAILAPTPTGLELLPLGRNPTLVNGAAISQRQELVDGDTVTLPGLVLMIELEGEPVSLQSWHLSTPWGDGLTLRGLPYRVGGGSDDDLILPGWPPSALVLRAAQGSLALELGVAATLDDEPASADTIEVVQDRMTVEIGGVRLEIAPNELAGCNTTRGPPRPVLPTHVTFEFLPQGGNLLLRFAQSPLVRIELAELRARLIAALLQPRPPWRVGDYLPDEVLIPAIWAGAERDRADLNLLIHRTRKDLLNAGLNPSVVLSRAKKGRATCFQIAAGAEVVVR